MEKEYSSCRLCPRECGINRTEKKGTCRVGSTLQVSRAALHMWEEPCISGTSGSGTVFFSGCSLGCVYCQNRAISRGQAGKEIGIPRLTEIFFELEEQGANNINLVTGDHYLPSIAEAIRQAKKEGFRLPFLLNTSSYIKAETLKRMEGLIDIYLPDLKYIREREAARYSHAPDYPEVAKAAIAEMFRQQPECRFISGSGSGGGSGENTEPDETTEPAETTEPDETTDPEEMTEPDEKAGSILTRGVVVRHMLLPGQLIQAKLIVSYLYRTYGDRIFISLLNQYTPMEETLREKYPELCRKVTEYEYHSLVEYAVKLGVTRGFVQEGTAAEESFIPAFDLTGV